MLQDTNYEETMADTRTTEHGQFMKPMIQLNKEKPRPIYTRQQTKVMNI